MNDFLKFVLTFTLQLLQLRSTPLNIRKHGNVALQSKERSDRSGPSSAKSVETDETDES